MKFKILGDNTNLSLRKARKEILSAKSTKARNKAAMELSDKLEQAQGFNVCGSLNYRSRARKLLNNLGHDVANLKRDLSDLSTKRKKELGYPLTPVGDRRRNKRKEKDIEHVNTYDDDLNLENTLSSPTKGLALQEELKMLSFDDSKWDKRRRNKNPINIIEKNKIHIQKMEEQRRQKQRLEANSIGNRGKTVDINKTIHRANMKRSGFGALNRENNTHLSNTINSINEFLYIDKNQQDMKKTSNANEDIIKKNIQNVKNIPSLKKKKLEKLHNMGYNTNGTRSSRRGNTSSRSNCSISTVASSSSSVTSISKRSMKRNNVRINSLLFNDRDYSKAPFVGNGAKVPLCPGVAFYKQFFRSSRTIAACVENWSCITMPDTLVYSKQMDSWVWLYNTPTEGMRRLEFENNDEFKTYMTSFVTRLISVDKQVNDTPKVCFPLAMLSRYHEDDLEDQKSTITEPLYNKSHVQGAILELFDRTMDGRKSIYSPSIVVIQKFTQSITSNGRVRIIRAVWKNKRQPQYYLIENKLSLQDDDEAYDVNINGDNADASTIIANKLLGGKATYVELALTPVMNELEKTIRETNHIILKDLIADFKFTPSNNNVGKILPSTKKLNGKKYKYFLTNIVGFSADKGGIDTNVFPSFNRKRSQHQQRRPSTTPNTSSKSRIKSKISNDIRSAKIQALKLKLLPADYMNNTLKYLPISFFNQASNTGHRHISNANGMKANSSNENSKFDDYTSDTRANDILNDIYKKTRTKSRQNKYSSQSLRRRPRTTNGAISHDGIHDMLHPVATKKTSCLGRFCDPDDLNLHKRFVQMPYKVLAFEHCASRLRPSKRWAVTEASVSVEDRYRLNETVYVCSKCHNEYTNREIARRELKKTHLNNIFNENTTDRDVDKYLNHTKKIKNVISNIKLAKPTGWEDEENEHPIMLHPLNVDSILRRDANEFNNGICHELENEDGTEELVAKKASIVLDSEVDDICLICFEDLKICGCM
jgi:hypothetical protein